MDRKPAGKRVHLTDDVQVVRGPKDEPITDGQLAGLLQTKGEEALVEVIEAKSFFEPLRIRAWVDRKAVIPGPPTVLRATGHGCCEGALSIRHAGQPGGTLAQDSDLRTDPTAAPFVRVPKGSRFRILERGPGDMRRVAFAWPRWDLDEYQIEVEGWMSSAGLPPTNEPRLQRGVQGRLLAKRSDGSHDFSGYRVRMTDGMADSRGTTVDVLRS